jgi:hypothetical protein
MYILSENLFINKNKIGNENTNRLNARFTGFPPHKYIFLAINGMHPNKIAEMATHTIPRKRVIRSAP